MGAQRRPIGIELGVVNLMNAHWLYICVAVGLPSHSQKWRETDTRHKHVITVSDFSIRVYNDGLCRDCPLFYWWLYSTNMKTQEKKNNDCLLNQNEWVKRDVCFFLAPQTPLLGLSSMHLWAKLYASVQFQS